MIFKNAIIFVAVFGAYLALAYGIGYWAGGKDAAAISLVIAFGCAFTGAITWNIIYNNKHK